MLTQNPVFSFWLQAIFGMSYTSKGMLKNLGSIFFSSQLKQPDKLILHSCPKLTFFSCTLPMQTDKKGTISPFSFCNNYSLSPTVLGRKREEWERRPLSPEVISHPLSYRFHQFRHGSREAFPAAGCCNFMNSAMASSRLSVPGYAPLIVRYGKRFYPAGRRSAWRDGCQSWKAARTSSVSFIADAEYMAADGIRKGQAEAIPSPDAVGEPFRPCRNVGDLHHV